MEATQLSEAESTQFRESEWAREKIEGRMGKKEVKRKRVKTLVGETASLCRKLKISFSFYISTFFHWQDASPIFSMAFLIIIQLIRHSLTHGQNLCGIVWGRVQTLLLMSPSSLQVLLWRRTFHCSCVLQFPNFFQLPTSQEAPK